MNPTDLIGPTSPLGYPAPYWFIVFFKTLGFALHMVPMNLWYAGLILAALFYALGGEHARSWARRLFNQMPIIIALGVNLGIVPLLFTQVAYYRVFYPATILMAWPWFSIFVLLTVAYYGVYIYATGLRQGRLSLPRQAAGWVAALVFIGIGFLFANTFSLMTNVDAWPGLWRGTSVAGGATGSALNTADPTLWPRWLMMFGLALTTTAAYTIVDTAFFAGKESEAYRRWAPGFAFRLYTLGIVWFALAAAWYVFATWRPEVRALMLGGPLVVLVALTALWPALPWLLILAQRQGTTQRLAFFTGLAQFGLLALNAVSRQIVQHAELGRFLDVTAEPVNLQLSPLIVFLVLFVIGLGIVAWMVSQVVQVERRPAPPDGAAAR